jgi:hypothetical protein
MIAASTTIMAGQSIYGISITSTVITTVKVVTMIRL